MEEQRGRGRGIGRTPRGRGETVRAGDQPEQIPGRSTGSVSQPQGAWAQGRPASLQITPGQRPAVPTGYGAQPLTRLPVANPVIISSFFFYCCWLKNGYLKPFIVNFFCNSMGFFQSKLGNFPIIHLNIFWFKGIWLEFDIFYN